jgi:hypothetical protein
MDDLSGPNESQQEQQNPSETGEDDSGPTN